MFDSLYRSYGLIFATVHVWVKRTIHTTNGGIMCTVHFLGFGGACRHQLAICVVFGIESMNINVRSVHLSYGFVFDMLRVWFDRALDIIFVAIASTDACHQVWQPHILFPR